VPLGFSAGSPSGGAARCLGVPIRAFKWAVENEPIPPSTFHGLQAVAGLKKGRSAAKETQKIRPVRAMVQVQRLTGMRPGEVVLMRPCAIDKSNGKTWVYRPEIHKTEHHGTVRVVCIGPRAQAILLPFLEGRHPGHYLFSPREGMAHFRAEQRKHRKTKVQPSQACRRKGKTRTQLQSIPSTQRDLWHGHLTGSGEPINDDLTPNTDLKPIPLDHWIFIRQHEPSARKSLAAVDRSLLGCEQIERGRCFGDARLLDYFRPPQRPSTSS